MPIELERSLALCADRAIFSDGDGQQIGASISHDCDRHNRLNISHMGWATEHIFLPLLRTSVPKPLGYDPTQISQIYETALAHLLPRHA